ncbi:hypothetical protein MNBD_GAMMA01-1333 [hydrothermal vent metagenome]|uniref:Uncharacterized protein n=1 Tax=hydrothermal vent metagenome TaxID=652676 RepID=A0A3B0V5V2_9ZZZZ
MADSFNKEEVILFEKVLEKFDSDNTVVQQAGKFTQPGSEMQRRGDTVWRPTPQISTVVTGLDITGNIGSITGMSVPASLSTIANVPFDLDALTLRDPLQMERKAESASQALSAYLNRAIADNVSNTGSLFVKKVGALTGYDDVALCETIMIENDIADTGKTFVFNARDYNAVASNLASRTLQPRSEKAYSDSSIGPVAGFNTYRTSYQKTLDVGGAGTTIAGAGQRHVPTSTSVAATGEEQNVDNRFMDINVTAGANLNVNDAFTIAGVNSVSHINKNDTGQLKTFRVTAINANVATITPPIIVAGATDAETDYANCSASPANLAAITVLNTVARPTNVFFDNRSIEVFGGNLAFPDDGLTVMRQSTDSGIEIIFAKQANVITGVITYRLTMFFGVTNLNPEMNGVLLANQT